MGATRKQTYQSQLRQAITTIALYTCGM